MRYFSSNLYLRAAFLSCGALIAIPLLMLLAILCLAFPPWLMTVSLLIIGVIAFVIVCAPLKFLLSNAKAVFTESIAAQAIFMLSSVLFWWLLCTVSKLLGEGKSSPLSILLLLLALFGMAWLNVSGILLIFNVAGFVLAVGRKLSRRARCTWYVSVVLFPTIAGMIHLYETGELDTSTVAFPFIVIGLAAWLGLRDFSHHPVVSSPSRYDPAAKVIARLFGGTVE